MLFQNEVITETKTCRHCSTSFSITDKDLEFYEKISPTFPSSPQWGEESKAERGFKKYLIPTPTLCPDCRQQQRLAHENPTKIYKRSCNSCNKSILSIYAPENWLTVYCPSCWYSWSWSPLYYGKKWQEWDSIFDLLKSVHMKVPKLSLVQINSENCDFCHNVLNSKNAYYCFANEKLEDAFFTYDSIDVKDSLDIWWSWNISRSYEINNCGDIYNCYYCSNSANLKDCLFCEECANCESCLFCYGIVGKKYHIFNKEVSKDEFEKTKKSLLSSSKNIWEAKEIMKKFSKKLPHCFASIDVFENVVWNYIYRSKDIIVGYNVWDSENCRYLYQGARNKDIFDSTLIYDSQRIFNSIWVDFGYNIFCSKNIVQNSSNIYYCTDIKNSKNCAFSSGLENAEYCIFNTQYTKEEYNSLLPKILWQLKELWTFWEFIPSHVSSFGYNESAAQDYYPLESSQLSAISQQTNTFKICKLYTGNWELTINWSDYEVPFPKVEKIIPASKLPDTINSVPDDILNWAIECETTKKPFRIIKQELEFYRKHNLPIPRRHPDQRNMDRIKERTPRTLWQRICMNPNCSEKQSSFLTSYNPLWDEIIYCKKCFENYKF
jgi:hypothetical protein